MDEYSEGYDFDEINSLQKQWLDIKDQVQKSFPEAYTDFVERLSRSWAIETGILEGLYTLDQGVTETLVEKGISANYIERNSTDKEPYELVTILKDHQNTLAFINEWISESRPLTTWFIDALHTRLTANQKTFRAVNQFGNAFDAQLMKGQYKLLPNNPSRPDGSLHEYCPPEQVQSEMDNLVLMYEEYDQGVYHPLLVAAWLHHRFSQIHPYQDGNGRVGRALLTYHLIRKGYLPIVISREDRTRYIETLEAADAHDLNSLTDLIVQMEKNTILRAISEAEPKSGFDQQLVDQVIDKIVDRIEMQRQVEVLQLRSVGDIAKKLRKEGTEYLNTKLQDTSTRLSSVGIHVLPHVDEGGPDHGNEHWYRFQVLETAKNAKHWLNFNEPRYFIKASLTAPTGSRNPRMIFVISLHSIGQRLTGIMAATAFAEIDYYGDEEKPMEQERAPFFRDCALSPFTFTWNDTGDALLLRFRQWTEVCLSLAVRYWGEFLTDAPISE